MFYGITHPYRIEGAKVRVKKIKTYPFVFDSVSVVIRSYLFLHLLRAAQKRPPKKYPSTEDGRVFFWFWPAAGLLKRRYFTVWLHFLSTSIYESNS